MKEEGLTTTGGILEEHGIMEEEEVTGLVTVVDKSNHKGGGYPSHGRTSSKNREKRVGWRGKN